MVMLSGCAARRRLEYIDSHPDLPEEIRQGILVGTIVKGMNKKEVILSLGKPTKKDIFNDAFGAMEVWTYGDCINQKCSMLYFNSGGQLLYFSRYGSE